MSKDLKEMREVSYTTERKNFPAGSDLVHPKTKDLLQKLILGEDEIREAG